MSAHSLPTSCLGLFLRCRNGETIDSQIRTESGYYKIGPMCISNCSKSKVTPKVIVFGLWSQNSVTNKCHGVPLVMNIRLGIVNNVKYSRFEPYGYVGEKRPNE